MKKLIILLLLASPCTLFAQAIHLPGAHLPLSKRVKPYALRPQSLYLDTSLSITNNVAMDTTVKTGTTTAPIRYNAAVLTTNFTIPLVRVNFLNNKPQNSTNSLVSTSFLSSVGAGLNYSWGELDQTLDANGNNASVDYYNHFGIQLGFLFASNASSGTSASSTTTSSTNQTSTVFALVGGISVLNFQLGAGYELGSMPAGQKRFFLTISYAIPMSVLVNGGYKIFRLKKIEDDDSH